MFVQPTEHGTELLRHRIDPFNSEVDVHFPDIAADIALEEFGIAKLEPVIPGLRHLRQETVKTIELLRGEL